MPTSCGAEYAAHVRLVAVGFRIEQYGRLCSLARLERALAQRAHLGIERRLPACNERVARALRRPHGILERGVVLLDACRARRVLQAQLDAVLLQQSAHACIASNWLENTNKLL